MHAPAQPETAMRPQTQPASPPTSTSPAASPWVTVARRAAATPGKQPPKPQTPAVLSMAPKVEDRMLSVHTRGSSWEKQTATEVVRTTNAALGHGSVVAANKLPSGDWRLMFAPGKKAEALKDRAWVSKAFGHSTTLAVPAHCVRIGRVSGLTQFGPGLEAHIREDNKLSTLEMTNVIAPRNNGPAALLIYIRDAQEANRVLREGALIEGSWYPATAFVSNGNVSQCERCWRFGHRAKYCQSSERCRRCGSSAHTMAACKVKAGKCVNCGKGHYANSAHCPKRKEEEEWARRFREEAPKAFSVADTVNTPRPQSALKATDRAQPPQQAFVFTTNAGESQRAKKRAAPTPVPAETTDVMTWESPNFHIPKPSEVGTGPSVAQSKTAVARRRPGKPKTAAEKASKQTPICLGVNTPTEKRPNESTLAEMSTDEGTQTEVRSHDGMLTEACPDEGVPTEVCPDESTLMEVCLDKMPVNAEAAATQDPTESHA